MRAVIVNFRGGFRKRRGDEAVIRILEKTNDPLIGRKAVWIDSRTGNRIIGRVVATHGNSGYRVRFRSGLPGWALGKEVVLP